ncbi:MAG: hypothetical protein IT320_20875 [Anaerolineae bacterium]|nr:hypothetical protein [Anaerolineae bacterium]
MGVSKHAGKVELDAADGSTLTDYSAEVTMATVNRTRNSGSYHTLGSDFEKTTQGGIVQDVTLEYEFAVGASSLNNVMRLWLESGGDKTLTISDPDDSVGSLELSGEFVLTGTSPYIDLAGGSGDPQKPRATLKPNGTTTTAIIST